MTQIVFIIGAGRSGSSVLHELIGYHPRVSWMSSLCETFPLRPEVNRRVLAAMQLPLLGRLLRRRYEPYECYRFFDVAYPGFGTPFRDLTASDVTVAAARSIKTRVSALSPSSRDVLIVKLTGWPRTTFLAELFPEARFVHLVRDGRAVAASLLRVIWWHGWRGPANWRFGPLPDEYEREWALHRNSFPALAAIEWKLVLDALDKSRDCLAPGRLIEIRYEDLCAEPEAVLSRVLAHCGLEWSDRLASALRRDPLVNRNDKWRAELGPEHAAVVEEVLQDTLVRYGYSVD